MARLLVFLLLWLVALAPAAEAHWADLAVADVRVHDQVATLTLTIPTGLVAKADDNHDGALANAEIQHHAAELTAQLGAAIQLSSGGKNGVLTVAPPADLPPGSDLAGMQGQHGTLALVYTFARPVKALTMHYHLFVPGVSTARCLATILVEDHLENVVFTPLSPDYTVGERTLWQQFTSFLGLGVEHILTGYDHCLFLISLLVLGGGLWYVLSVVTAFTLAHSVTLSLSALGLVSLPPPLTESAIALTIAYVAAENFWRKSLRGRWAVTFLFGLVHGFGFASALRETGLPKDHVALSLAGFNLGVEVGQLLVVVVAYSLLGLVRGRPWERAFRHAVSAMVIAVALFWFAQRAFF